MASFWIDTANAILALTSDSGTGELLWIPLDGTPSIELLPEVKELSLLEDVGDALVAAVRQELPLGSRIRLLRIPLDDPQALQVLADAPEFVVLDRPAPLAAGSLGLVASVGAAQFLVRLDGAGLTLLSSNPATFGPTLGGSLAGTLTASYAPVPTVAFPFGWQGTSVAPLAITPVGGFVLP